MPFSNATVEVNDNSFTINSYHPNVVRGPQTEAERQFTTPTRINVLGTAALSAIRWAAPQAPRLTGPLFDLDASADLPKPSANFQAVLDAALNLGRDNHRLAWWGGYALDLIYQANRLIALGESTPNEARLTVDSNADVDLAIGLSGGQRVTELMAQISNAEPGYAEPDDDLLRLAARAANGAGNWAALRLLNNSPYLLRMDASVGNSDGTFVHAETPHQVLDGLQDFAQAIRYALGDQPTSV